MSTGSRIRFFKALSEESRYKIVEALLKGERCACELPNIIGRTQSNTSMHLGILTDLGMLQSRRDGKKIIYSIRDKRIYEIFEVIK